MFSDVVGYTAIMGRDEHAALRALQESAQLLANPDGTRQVVLYGFTTRPRFRLSSFAAAQSK